MKQIKMKDIILSHYQKVHEIEMDGYTVRVFKPKTMQHLPAYCMLEWIKKRSGEAVRYMKWEPKAKADWSMGNPDFGLWDALTVYHYDPRHKLFEIYVASIIVRPYSRESYEAYCRQHEILDDVNQRLMLMWDSRENDRINGYDQSYGAYKNQDEADAMMYRVSDKERDIADHSPSCYLQIVDDEDEFSPVHRKSVTLRQSLTGEVEYHAVMGTDDTFKDGGTPLMHAAAKCYAMFRKEHPEVTEMRFYTDELTKINDDDEEAGE
jgi:hypothetical protein